MITNVYQGRIPFEPRFFAANGDKKAFATFTLAMQTNQKDETTGYYKEVNIRCKTFGGWAESLMNKWNETGNKTYVDIEGELTMGNDYEKDGEIVKGQIELNVLRIHDYNTLDKTIVRGKIPNFENAIRYTASNGEKKSYAFFTIAISTGVKNEETGYYEERLVKCKTFGATADFLNNFYQNGDFITLEGKYVDGQDYEKDGEMVKAQPELLVTNIHGFARRKEDGNTSSKKTTPITKKIGASPKTGIATPQKKLPQLGGMNKPASGGIKLPGLKK